MKTFKLLLTNKQEERVMQKVLAVMFLTAVMLFLLGGCEKITDPATVNDNPILEKKGE